MGNNLPLGTIITSSMCGVPTITTSHKKSSLTTLGQLKLLHGLLINIPFSYLAVVLKINLSGSGIHRPSNKRTALRLTARYAT